ncbi:PQQ-like beta-propeller repeat protein [Streptomyces sp. NBC_01255]|uniref:outer membrane protein assembly factor BamB family protein n=1 Tax=Streptomyces sp. NBC_01255 TaxID=2903798 RepID=UPI002E3613DF|nr:PQQ-binding-like beta-propeller repeat protein [Streptomyces sp. NBC_01255]
MTPEHRGPTTAVATLSGAAFGAAAVLLGAGVVAADWPTGWAAVVCALVLTAVGVTVRAAGSRTEPAAASSGTPGAEPEDAVPGDGPSLDKTTTTAPVAASRGRSSLVAAAVVWALAVLAGGIWAATSGGDEGGEEASKGGAPAVSTSVAPSTSASTSASTSTSDSALDRTPAVAWTVPATGPRGDTGIGFWGLGSTVAQGRVDGLFAYDGAHGTVRWSVPAPTREALCAMSPDIGEGVGLVAHGRHEKPCSTLLAVRTSDGKVMWQRKLGGKGLVKDALAVGGTTAVTAEDGAVRARSAESGEQRWQRAHPRGCKALALDADATRTLLVEQCGKGARLLALDTRTGAQRWSRDLPVESAATAAVVSVSPVVVAVDEADARGTQAFLGFDDKGVPTVTVPLSGPEGILSAPGDVGDGRTVRPVVRDGLLVTFAESAATTPNRLVAYALKDGRPAWVHKDDGQLMAFAAAPGGRVAYLDYSSKVTVLDGTTGTVHMVLEPDPAGRADISIEPELVAVPGGHVVLNQILVAGEPAALALR